jgi:AraC-like DNA-binding protein
MFGSFYDFVRCGAGLSLIVAGIAFVLDRRRGRLRVPLGVLFLSVGLLFSLSALNPSWPALLSDGSVLALVYLVSQSFYEIVLYLLGGEQTPHRTSRLYIVGALWAAVLLLVPLLDGVLGWGPIGASVEDRRALAPLHAIAAAGTYAWPVVVTLIALLRGRWKLRDLPMQSRLIHAVLTGCGVLVLVLATVGLALILDNEVLYRIGQLLLTAWMLGLFWLMTAVPDLCPRVRQAIGVEHRRRLSIGDLEANEIDLRLGKLVTEHEIYRRTGLTVASLARDIKVPDYRLSRHFSQHLGTTFPAWINALRIAWVCDRLVREPGRTSLDIAMDAGYSSKAVFHAQFEKARGMNPGDYRRRLGAGKPLKS